jgi:hypothetical protein
MSWWKLTHSVLAVMNARRPDRSTSQASRGRRAPMERKRTAMNLRLQAVNLALGELAGTHLERDLANLVMLSLGTMFHDFVKAGTDSHDLEIIEIPRF